MPKALSPESYDGKRYSLYYWGEGIWRYIGPNGTSMRPNTSTQRDIVGEFRGSSVLIYADDLILVHESRDHYSLQAKKEMTVEGRLDMFRFGLEQAVHWIQQSWTPRLPTFWASIGGLWPKKSGLRNTLRRLSLSETKVDASSASSSCPDNIGYECRSFIKSWG